MTAPTARQLAIHAWMLAYQREQGAPPSLRTIGEHFAIRSTNCVSGHLVALSKRGLVRRGPRSWTAVEPFAPPSALAAEVLRVDRVMRSHPAAGPFTSAPTPGEWRKLVALAQAEGGTP
jgi:SOS-response transcriptional repressor LexA